MSGLGITVSGGPEIRKALDDVAAAVADLSEPFGTIVSYVQLIENKRFAQEGPGWAPLSPLYAKWKALHAGGKPILVLSGHLRDSLTGGDGWTETITPQRLEAGSSVPYGRYHQDGTARMPARPPLTFEDTDTDQFARTITEYLQKAASKSGLGASL